MSGGSHSSLDPLHHGMKSSDYDVNVMSGMNMGSLGKPDFECHVAAEGRVSGIKQEYESHVTDLSSQVPPPGMTSQQQQQCMEEENKGEL